MNRRFLNIFIFIFMLIALAVMTTSCQNTIKNGKKTNGAKPLRLVISAPPSVSIKAPLRLIGYLQNTTEQPVSFGSNISNGYNVYTDVTDDKNRDVDFPYKNLTGRISSMNPIETLAPQEKLILGNRDIGLIALTTPGKYSVQVTVNLHPNWRSRVPVKQKIWSGKLKSNILTVTVTK